MISRKNMKHPKGCGNHADIFPRNILCVIAGSTGSGKTNLMVNLLLQENKINYSDVYIYSPTLHQPAIHLFETLIRANGENHYEQDETVCENCTFL